MSIRQYRPRIAERRTTHIKLRQLTSLLLVVVIAEEILYPLLHSHQLQILTVAIVYSAALLALLHALISYGAKYFWLYFSLTLLFSYGVELLGSKTGWPFGHYSYSRSLGISLSGVPVVVPFAWVMMVHPILVTARKISSHWTFLIGGLGLAIWDLFLDPQMVASARWIWSGSFKHIPLEPTIPLSNFAGWMLSGMAIMAILNKVLPRDRRKNGASTIIIDIFLGWVLVSGVIGNLFFFHSPGVAVVAGIPFTLYLGIYLFNSRITKPN